MEEKEQGVDSGVRGGQCLVSYVQQDMSSSQHIDVFTN